MRLLVVFNFLVFSILETLSGAYTYAAQVQIENPLGQLPLFVRCYRHITNQPPAANLAVYQEVKNGSKTAVDACMEVLATAALNSAGVNEGRLVTDSALGRRILTQFNSLHRSFFSVDNTSSVPDFDCRQNNIKVHDTTVGALAYTRVLFNSGVNFSEVLNNRTPVEAIRSLGTPTITPLFQTQAPGSAVEVDWPGVLGVSRGELMGVVQMSAVPGRFNQMGNSRDSASAMQIHASPQAAGVLATSSYIQMNYGHLDRIRTDGAVKMPRRLARNVFSDFLCRSVPVIQLSDASLYVQPGSAIPFRGQASCMQCHATMDPMAAAWRNAQVTIVPQQGDCGNNERTNHLIYHPATQADATLFPAAPDANFYQRPAKFMFLYRDTDGVLHRVQGVGLSELSNVILGLDDLYRCTAARYLKFFTGINVSLFDPSDPTSTTRTAADQEYFDLVKTLGASLKDHKSLNRLIREIISTPLYGSSTQRSTSESTSTQQGAE